MTTTYPVHQTLPDLDGVRLGAAGFVLLVVATVDHVLGWSVPVSYAVLTGVALLACPTLPRRHAALIGATCWCLLTGFVVNSGGQLTFSHHDLLRLLSLVGLSVGAASLGVARARAGSHPRRLSVDSGSAGHTHQ